MPRKERVRWSRSRDGRVQVREMLHTKSQRKIGLVVEGGGMKCAYNAGILDAFLDEGITFDYCIGVSGVSGNLASYLAGQRGRNLLCWTRKNRHCPWQKGVLPHPPK